MIKVKRWLKNHIPNKHEMAEFNALREELTPGCTPWTVNDFEKFIAHPSVSLVVASKHDRDKDGSDNKKIIGMGSLHTQHLMTHEVVGWIHDVIVLPKHQNQGIATKLDAELRAIAHEQKIKKVRLTSRPDRIDANQFYQRRGYKQITTNVYELTLA